VPAFLIIAARRFKTKPVSPPRERTLPGLTLRATSRIVGQPPSVAKPANAAGAIPFQPMNRLKIATALALVATAAALAFSGCAHVTAGQKIERGSVAFIRPGVTTKDMVIANLGEPLVELEHGRVIAYVWEWHAGAHVNYGVLGGHRKRESADAYQAFCVAFDASNRATHRGFVTDIKPGTLDDAVLQWSKSGRD
jgi:outer membrane protein assembly factor BamE (lipoprotein component of BamABCDE complex)